ncbi:hypothetical protein [Bacteroides sp.]|uniref:hypothetical protein n=1 Tax=Bacteroides sp. TaxID=29523 RepID=UPI0025BB9062|nr:hypothetical protein [Bacteroides sp.]
MQSGDIRYEGKGDEQAAKTQCAVFVFMTDSTPVQSGDTITWHLPFKYNFDDYAGREDWSNMFVSRMMQIGKGNCHSMPLLYKLIMDRLGEKCWLSLAGRVCRINGKKEEVIVVIILIYLFSYT